MPARLAALQQQFHDAVLAGNVPIYSNAYYARIHGVLADDYPKLAALLGDDAFRALVVPYLRVHPTTHPSLREAGVHLPGFLAEPIYRDLARLERARVEAFDGPDATPLARDDLAALAPEAFPSLPLRLVPTAQLVTLATNADEVWDALEAGAAAPARVTSPRTVLVWRREITVVHRTLDADEATALARGGTFGHVCEALAVERALELLLRWLDAGLIA